MVEVSQYRNMALLWSDTCFWAYQFAAIHQVYDVFLFGLDLEQEQCVAKYYRGQEPTPAFELRSMHFSSNWLVLCQKLSCDTHYALMKGRTTCNQSTAHVLTYAYYNPCIFLQSMGPHILCCAGNYSLAPHSLASLSPIDYYLFAQEGLESICWSNPFYPISRHFSPPQALHFVTRGSQTVHPSSLTRN